MYWIHSESELQVLENQLADVRSALSKERQEIGSLIGTFAAGASRTTYHYITVDVHTYFIHFDLL